jgi:hypothetical protein
MPFGKAGMGCPTAPLPITSHVAIVIRPGGMAQFFWNAVRNSKWLGTLNAAVDPIA